MTLHHCFQFSRTNRRLLGRTRLNALVLERRDVPALFSVTTNLDSGAGSLRQAILDANANAGPDSIGFSPIALPSATTVTLQSALPNIATDGLFIVGPGRSLLTVNRDTSKGNFRFVTVSEGASLGVSGATISGFAIGATDGGAILADINSSLTISDVVLANNTAGGIGGALHAQASAIVSIVGSTLQNNTAVGGGAISLDGGAQLTLDRSYATGNKATGIEGGGVVYGTLGAQVSIINSTLYSNLSSSTNSLSGGGAISLQAITANSSIFNSTLTGNSANSGNGGGVAIDSSGGAVTLNSSIVSGNTGSNGPDLYVFGGGSVLADSSAVGNQTLGLSGLSGTGNLTAAQCAIGPTGLNLSTPANNGGPSFTASLGKGSTAIDAGLPNNQPTDQRGSGFPRVNGAAADIGAFEAPSVIPSATGQFSNITANSGSASFTVTYTDDTSINFSTVNNKSSLIAVTGPNGYSELATFVSATPTANGPSITVTYSIPPNSAGLPSVFDVGDNGVYTAVLTGGVVADTDSPVHTIPQTTLGNFAVRIATTFTVTNTNDDGAGSLREALTNADASEFTQDTITFAGGVTGTISPLSPYDIVTDSLVIQGPGSKLLTIDAAGNFNIFTLQGPNSIDVRLSGLTLTQGASSDGGAIYVEDEFLTLTDVVVSNSTAGNNGGAIYLASPGAKLTLIGSTLKGNVADGGTNSNGGGAIFANTGSQTVTVVSSTLSGNSASGSGRGGAIYFFIGGVLNIDNSTLANNASGDDGGAIALYTPTVTIRNSTIADNTAGGLGGGIRVVSTASVTLVSSIVGDNQASGVGPDINNVALIGKSGIVNADHSLIGNATGLTLTNDSVNLKNTATGIDTLGLGSYGGPTQTLRLLVTSPALDKGSNPGNFLTDQRGNGFDRLSGPGVDIGAYEFFNDAPSAKLNTAPNVTAAQYGQTAYNFTVTYTDNVAVLASSLQGNTSAVSVVGPSGTLIIMTAVIDTNTNGNPRAVTYTATPPGGSWDSADGGIYTISLNGGQVSDINGNKALATTLGTFSVQAPSVFLVTTTADYNPATVGAEIPGSLRSAIAQANAIGNTADTIAFSSLFDSPQTIALSNGQITISDSLVLSGKGASLLTINTGGKTGQRHFTIDNGAASQISVTLSGVTLTGGNGVVTGGSIQTTDESLTLSNVVVSGNSATASGGAVFAGQKNAVITVTGSSFVNNTASGTSSSSGGGAIRTQNVATISVQDSTFSGNLANGAGGAINQYYGGRLTVTGSTLSGNTAKGANGGGAVYFYDAIPTNGFVVSNSTLDGNSATTGAGGAFALANVSGTASVINSTITGNTVAAGKAGGGVSATGASVPTFVFASTIIAGNKTLAASPVATDIGSTGTVNISKSAYTTASGFTPTGTGNVVGFDPAVYLDPLASNGGPTQTRALKSGANPAKDAGSNTAGLTYDQRGTGFNRVSGVATDIGAYELQAAATPAKVVANSLVINAGAAQRSALYSVAIDFTDSVALTATPAFTLTPSAGGSAITPTVTLTNGNKTAVLSFGTTNTFATSIGKNGLYTLSIDGSKLVSNGLAVDGDGDGNAGGTYTLAGSKANGLFRLYGDANGSGAVDAQDVTLFLNTYGTSNGNSAYRDYLDSGAQGGYNGAVDAQDVTDFLNTYGVTLP